MLYDPTFVMAGLFDTAALKVNKLREVVQANQLHKELETMTLEQVLAKHLPASDPAQLKTAADDMLHAINESYQGMGKQVTRDWVAEQFNSVLGGRSSEEQGRWLVNLLQCSEKVNPDTLQGNSRWQELQNAESFQAQDVAELMEMAHDCLDDNASFMARQEFHVMEGILDRLPYEVVDAQINSGADYAAAYAAAMYIQNQKSTEHDPSGELKPTAYELGLLAVNSVESSRLLAQYHLGKVRLEEAIPRLQALAKRMLTLAGKALLQVLAVGLRLGIAYVAGHTAMAAMITLGVVSTTALWVVPTLVATLTFLSFTQEEVVNEITTVWNWVKSIVNRALSFFQPGEEASVNIQEKGSVFIQEEPEVTPPENIVTV